MALCGDMSLPLPLNIAPGIRITCQFYLYDSSLSNMHFRLSYLNCIYSAFPSQKNQHPGIASLWYVFLFKKKKLGLNFPPPLIRRFPEIVRTSLTYWSNASMQPWAVYRDKEQNVFKILIIYSKKILGLVKLSFLWYQCKVCSSRTECRI